MTIKNATDNRSFQSPKIKNLRPNIILIGNSEARVSFALIEIFIKELKISSDVPFVKLGFEQTDQSLAHIIKENLSKPILDKDLSDLFNKYLNLKGADLFKSDNLEFEKSHKYYEKLSLFLKYLETEEVEEQYTNIKNSYKINEIEFFTETISNKALEIPYPPFISWAQYVYEKVFSFNISSLENDLELFEDLRRDLKIILENRNTFIKKKAS